MCFSEDGLRCPAFSARHKLALEKSRPRPQRRLPASSAGCGRRHCPLPGGFLCFIGLWPSYGPLSLASLDSSPARGRAKTYPLGYCLPRLRDCAAEALPAAETAEAEQGQRSAFCKPAATGAAKTGHRNRGPQGQRGQPAGGPKRNATISTIPTK